jgi:hypothetical protein
VGLFCEWHRGKPHTQVDPPYPAPLPGRDFTAIESQRLVVGNFIFVFRCLAAKFLKKDKKIFYADSKRSDLMKDSTLDALLTKSAFYVRRSS